MANSYKACSSIKKSWIIMYDPSRPSPEYAIAHEMAKFIRTGKAPKGKQMIAIPTKKTTRHAVQSIQKELKFGDGPDQYAEEEFKSFYESLLCLLTNTPGNFWISKSLYTRPGLKTASLKELQQMFSPKKARKNLSNVKRYPNTLLKAMNALDGAYALFLDKLFGRVRFFKPYKGTEFEKLAIQLVKLNKKDKGYAGDIDVINKWAKILGLDGFFEWKRC